MEVAPAVSAASPIVSTLAAAAPILLLLLIAIYFIPTIIAIKRKHLQKTAIILLNVFLGWSFIGWVIALIWSVMKEQKA